MGDEVHEQGGAKRAKECTDRQRPDAERAEDSHRDDDGRADRRTGGNAEDVGIGEGVAHERLHECAGDGEPCARDDGQYRSRQPQLPDDGVCGAGDRRSSHVPLQDGDDRVQRDFLGAEPEGHDGDDNGQSQQNEGEEKGGNSPAARHGRARNALAAG